MNRVSFIIATALLTALSLSAQTPRLVESRPNAKAKQWTAYETVTVDRLPGFKLRKKDPGTDSYGGWTCASYEATGFFRTEKVGDRWWIIDPEGHPYIIKGVAVFSMGGSDRQKAAVLEKFGTPQVWASTQMDMLRSYGFNSLGAWSRVEEVRKSANPLPYTVIVNPMGMYHSVHLKRYGGKYLRHGWQNYRFDLAMVFDPEFDKWVEKALEGVSRYKDDPNLVGYFTDNELPWVNDALDRHLTLLAKDEPGYLAAEKWFKARKGETASVADITPEDREAFNAFYLETYLRKVTTALRKYDPNHMYLGCRFNQHKEELVSKSMFEVAGKYMDIISINHYRKWQPDSQQMSNWIEWSGKPFIITEFYTKGEDSGLPNNTGAGWNVRTQEDRGWFYQNFTMELLKSKGCVGWHWFTYMDNDPENLHTDYSNRDSNKGVVKWNFEPYTVLLDEMKQLNDRVWNLIQYFDKK